jgi:hypothetical protein
MAEKNLQEQLFQAIRESLPPSLSFIDAIAEALHLSTDSAYRRIRGETPLVLEEVKVLCRQFSVSLDQLMQTASDAVVFHPVLVNNLDYTFDHFLSGIIQALQQLAAASQKEMIYMSKDIPLFHYFQFKPLLAFRYFFWMKSILQHPDFVNQTFSMTHITPALERKAIEISKLYKGISSTEIWNSESINSMLAQIDYYREAGYISSLKDVGLLYDALRETLEHVSNQAEWGCKFLPGENSSVQQSNYRLLANQVVIGDNTILVMAEGRKTVYINYDVLNYITTSDAAFCNATYNRLENLMQRATLLSDGNEKQRRVFFNSLLKRIPHYQTVF